MVLTRQSRSAVCRAKTGSYVLTAHVEDFEMEGVSIAAIPFSMAIEAPDSSALIAQFDELIEGTGKLDTGAEDLEVGQQLRSQRELVSSRAERLSCKGALKSSLQGWLPMWQASRR